MALNGDYPREIWLSDTNRDREPEWRPRRGPYLVDVVWDTLLPLGVPGWYIIPGAVKEKL